MVFGWLTEFVRIGVPRSWRLNETVSGKLSVLKKIARIFFIPYQKIEHRKGTILTRPWIEEGKRDAPLGRRTPFHLSEPDKCRKLFQLSRASLLCTDWRFVQLGFA